MRKLYLFNNTVPEKSGWNHCVSMADDGHVLGSHICSSPGFMRHDLTQFAQRIDELKKHFGGVEGEAFEVVVVPQGELPPEDVLEKNKQLQAREEK